MADRYFAPDAPLRGTIVLTGDESRHLARVARRAPGDEVEVFDGLGGCVRARVAAIGKDRVELVVVATLQPIEPSRRLTLYVAAPKGERLDWLVEKATEIGVESLVPVLTERSVVDPRPAKLDRLRRVVVEASKQSGRSRLMTLADPIPLARALAEDRSDSRFLADSGGIGRSDWPESDAVAVAVGPEGGWTESERSLAEELGWVRIGLGPARLRVETAALAASALILSASRKDDDDHE